MRTVDLMLAQAVRDRASDIHIEPQRDQLRVRFRIDGILHEALRLPLSVHGPLVTRIKVLANMNIAERRRPQDGQIAPRSAATRSTCGWPSMETTNGEMMVLRMLDKSFSLIQLARAGPAARCALDRHIRAAAGAVRHGPGQRPHRLGQDDDALRLASTSSTTKSTTSSPSRTRSSTGSTASTRSRSTRRPTSPSPGACGR